MVREGSHNVKKHAEYFTYCGMLPGNIHHLEKEQVASNALCKTTERMCIYSNVDAVRQASTYRLNENRRHEAFSEVERQNELFEEREKNH